MIGLDRDLFGLVLIVVVGIVFGNILWVLIKSLFKSIRKIFRRKK